MIHVLATIELAPGIRDRFLAEFRRIIPAVRAEQGCAEYGPAIEVATNFKGMQPPRENIVVVVEKWATLADLEAHLVAPHMMEYRPRVKDLVVGTQLQVLEAVE